jgi:hypothetical protein
MTRNATVRSLNVSHVDPWDRLRNVCETVYKIAFRDLGVNELLIRPVGVRMAIGWMETVSMQNWMRWM